MDKIKDLLQLANQKQVSDFTDKFKVLLKDRIETKLNSGSGKKDKDNDE